MNVVTIPIAAVLVLLSMPSLLTARAGARGAYRRQGRLGIHTLAASASDEAFALANRVAAPIYYAAGVVGVVIALLVLLVKMPTAASIVIGVIGLVGLLALFVAAGNTGEKAARGVPVPARKAAGGANCGGCACGSGGCAGLTRTAAAETA